MTSYRLTLALAVALAGAAPALAADNETVSIDIYAIPSQKIVQTVGQVSDELGKRGMQTFYKQGHPVHATLYLTDYPKSAEDKLKSVVEQLAKAHQSFPLTVDGITVTAGNWVFLGVDRTRSLQRLADEAVLAAEPLREHATQPPAWMANYPQKLPAFERYGSPNVFMQFDPHLTLLASEKNPNLADFVAWAKQNAPHTVGKVVGIGFGEADASGQITKTLGEFRFDAAN